MSIKDEEIDRQHCLAIVHEYHRCKDAFNLFAATAEKLYATGQTREISYRAYNAYASFILHLYEFLVSLHARDLGVSEIRDSYGRKKHELLDLLVQSTANKVVSNRISNIEAGIAPEWKNHISSYQRLMPIPSAFAQSFRRMRNHVAGHVTYKRIGEIDLTKFYETYHPYLYLMYRDCGDWWANRSDEFPELEQVTDFLGAIARALRTEDGAE
jgi:hypothetical protein